MTKHRNSLWLLGAFWGSVAISVAVVLRRLVALAEPSHSGPSQMTNLDATFASHSVLTLMHILTALLFVLLLPFALLRRSRWAERLMFPLGGIVGITAYLMSVNAVGGWGERSAVILFNSAYLISLAKAERFRRIGAVGQQRRWMLRAVGILLGIATTRPVMGVFFATSHLTHLQPRQFFGLAFWVGFSINAIAVELWLHYEQRSRTRYEPSLKSNQTINA